MGDPLTNKYNIKNLLFAKAVPNYVIPIPTNGHKIFPCMDCGDKFIFKSSQEYHINRKSVQIKYMCRPCGMIKIFYNKCNFLAHIRNHCFKTVTINMSDLSVEPLPMSFINNALIKTATSPVIALTSTGCNITIADNSITSSGCSVTTTGSSVTTTGISVTSAGRSITDTVCSITSSGSSIPSTSTNITSTVGSTTSIRSISKSDTVTSDIISLPSTSKSVPTEAEPSNERPVISKQELVKNVIIELFCFECKTKITNSFKGYQDRGLHYQQYTNEIHICPVCLFALPTSCGLRAHLRLHLKMLPYYCTDCGIELNDKQICYPFKHNCESFQMMRAVTRIACTVEGCRIVHPSDFPNHMKDNHIKKVFKCPVCVVASFSKKTIGKHLETHKDNTKPFNVYYQCQFCPGRLLMLNQFERHANDHFTNVVLVYRCWACSQYFKEVLPLLDHFVKCHPEKNEISQPVYKSMINECQTRNSSKGIYRVVKRCDRCQRNFSYRCKYNEIANLPNECPYQCSIYKGGNKRSKDQITCWICNEKISQDWDVIKEHYAQYHKEHKCLDLEVGLKKIDHNNIKKKRKIKNRSIKKTTLRKSRELRLKFIQDNSTRNISDSSINDSTMNSYTCNKCEYVCDDRKDLETHMITHRDPCTAYQCMECGQCFVVKPSFSTHLLLNHGISDVEDYIKTKKCYNENALLRHQYGSVSIEPLKENQCNICREQFESPEDLQKHYRVHGMAFLKNTKVKTS